MDARGRQAQQYIAGLNPFTSDQSRFFRHTNGKTGDIIFTIRIKSRHLRRLATDQGTARLFAGPGHAAHDVGDFFRLQFADGDIVQKEQRFGALDQNIVDAHGDRILADGIMFVHHKGQLELGSHPVRAGNQNRLRIFAGIQGKQSAEATDV